MKQLANTIHKWSMGGMLFFVLDMVVHIMTYSMEQSPS